MLSNYVSHELKCAADCIDGTNHIDGEKKISVSLSRCYSNNNS